MPKFDPDNRTYPEWIKHLNLIAQVFEDNTDLTPREIIDRTAAECGLKLVAEKNGKRIYRTPNSHHLNARVIGEKSSHVEDGGIGFDEKIHWWGG